MMGERRKGQEDRHRPVVHTGQGQEEKSSLKSPSNYIPAPS